VPEAIVAVKTPVERLVILGGGPAGLGVAFYAHRAGVPFVLLEASSEPGGMCRTLRCGEHLYDCGAHRFHDRDPEVTRDLVGLLGDELARIDAPSTICDRGRYLDFPPTPLNAVFGYGLRDALRIGLDLARSILSRGTSANFEELAVGRFGRTLARRILLDYSEKLWGLPADELSPDVATRRLQGMTLRSLIRELVVPGRKTEHLDGSFLYPRRGYGQITDALVSALPPGSIRTDHEVVSLECEAGVVRRIRCSGGRTLEAPERVVSTLPMPLLARFLGAALPDEARAAASRMRFRHLRLLFFRIRSAGVSRYASIYVPDPAFSVSRIYEPRNRSAAMAPDGETSLVAEVPCFPGDDVERLPDEALAERVKEELGALRIRERLDIAEWRHHRIPNAYPVYSIDYAENVRVLQEAIASITNLETIGRAGRFLYSHLHDQLRFGKDYARKLADPRRTDSPCFVPADQTGPARERRDVPERRPGWNRNVATS
jgi:protoporphyrinogen oxidase